MSVATQAVPGSPRKPVPGSLSPEAHRFMLQRPQVLILAAFVIALAESAVEPAITVRVVYVNGAPAFHQDIEVVSENGEVVLNGLTDKSGEFVIHDLGFGQHRLVV